MRFSDGSVGSFKEIMNEFFYDWGMTSSPQIHKETEGFWINKTALFKEDDKFYLTYKTSCFEVSEEAFTQFEKFYAMIEKDQEFEDVLSMMENHYNNNDLQKTNQGFTIGSLSLVAENLKYMARDSNFEREIKKSTFQKIQAFYNLMNP